MSLTMLHLPRTEDRILALFADLAGRFGRVTPAGILIDPSLNHELIGRLTVTRRPTATLALQHLYDQGLLGQARRQLVEARCQRTSRWRASL